MRGGRRGEGHGQLARGQAARTTSVSKLLVEDRLLTLVIIVIRTEQRSRVVFDLHLFDHGFFML